MPLLKLQVADYPTDDTPTTTHTEWINAAQIETVSGYLSFTALEPVLWLEVAMTSGAVRFVLVGPVWDLDLTAATEAAIDDFLPTR